MCTPKLTPVEALRRLREMLDPDAPRNRSVFTDTAAAATRREALRLIEAALPEEQR